MAKNTGNSCWERPGNNEVNDYSPCNRKDESHRKKIFDRREPSLKKRTMLLRFNFPEAQEQTRLNYGHNTAEEWFPFGGRCALGSVSLI